MIKRWSFSSLVSMLVAIALVAGLSMAMTGEDKLMAAQKKAEIKAASSSTQSAPTGSSSSRIGNDLKTLGFFYVSGIIAICAMILPGISGSFMMLMMGVYFDILICINELLLVPLSCFALGCITGLLVFTRFLNFLLRCYHDLTMSFLLGLVLGSLYAIWPFKSFGMADGRRVDIENMLPAAFTQNEAVTIITFVAGCLLVAAFIIIEKKSEKKSH
jgi:putative membrane protein